MKTQKISGNVTNIQLESEALCLEFSESYPYYWIENRSANEVLISLEKEPVKGSDGSYSVSAGSNIRVSGGFDRKLVLLGSGEVQVIASIIAECPFKSAPAVSGGGGNADVTVDAFLSASSENPVQNKAIKAALDNKADKTHTHTVSNISDFPEIPTEETVAEWGFTKNSGTYVKPDSGIPKSDLSSAVQASLTKADTALQSYTEKYTGTYIKPDNGIPKSDLAEEVQELLEKAEDTKTYDVVVTGKNTVMLDNLQAGVPFSKISIPYVTGKNHFIISGYTEDTYNSCLSVNNENGTFSYSRGIGAPNIYFRDYIPILPNTDYTLSIDFTVYASGPSKIPYNNLSYRVYDKDKKELSSESKGDIFKTTGQKSVTFRITNEEACYIKFHISIIGNGSGYLDSGTFKIPQLEIGDTVTDYELPNVNSTINVNDTEYNLSSSKKVDFDISREGININYYENIPQRSGENTISVVSDSDTDDIDLTVYGVAKSPLITQVYANIDEANNRIDDITNDIDEIKANSPTIQTGSFTTSAATYTVTFPTAFTGTPTVTAICTSDSTDSTNKTGSISVSSVSTTSVTFNCFRGTGTNTPSSTYTMPYSWIAVYTPEE